MSLSRWIAICVVVVSARESAVTIARAQSQVISYPFQAGYIDPDDVAFSIPQFNPYLGRLGGVQTGMLVSVASGYIHLENLVPTAMPVDVEFKTSVQLVSPTGTSFPGTTSYGDFTFDNGANRITSDSHITGIMAPFDGSADFAGSDVFVNPGFSLYAPGWGNSLDSANLTPYVGSGNVGFEVLRSSSIDVVFPPPGMVQVDPNQISLPITSVSGYIQYYYDAVHVVASLVPSGGSVTITPSVGAPFVVAPGATFYLAEGDDVTSTSGTAKISFPGGDYCILGPGSEFKLLTPPSTLDYIIDLIHGSFSDIFSTNPRYNIRTGPAVLTIRGTEYSIDFEPPTLSVSVKSGTVEVTDSIGTVYEVTAGENLTITVPEPSGLALAALGLVGVAAVAIRRRRR